MTCTRVNSKTDGFSLFRSHLTRLVFFLLVSFFLAGSLTAQDAAAKEGAPARGEVQSAAGASKGYTLFAPLLSTRTYLIDHQGQAVRVWESDFGPGGSVYLLDDGSLLRCQRLWDVPVFHGGGQGGKIQRFSWEGKLLWDFTFANEEHLQHHDIEPLPNGNILLIAWEKKSQEEARSAGRRPDLVPKEGLWPDCVFEIRPILPDKGEVVWEWHSWDHMVQDHDPKVANYRPKVSDHPELIDINGNEEARQISKEELKELKALGYVAGNADVSQDDLRADFGHTNAVAYNAKLDQIALSVSRFDEIWIIDHSTTTAEAAGPTGGRSGKGGDLLYRWGNPRTYGRGTKEDQRLFSQHDVRWIPEGFPGAGNLMVFNNGPDRPDGSYSSVIEFQVPVDSRGLPKPPSSAFGPVQPVWEYVAEERKSFYSWFISGAHRLANGNTFICSGAQGRFFEVSPAGDIVWEYYNPYTENLRKPDGKPPHPGLDKVPNAVFRATRIPPDHPALVKYKPRPLDPQPPRGSPPADAK